MMNPVPPHPPLILKAGSCLRTPIRPAAPNSTDASSKVLLDLRTRWASGALSPE